MPPAPTNEPAATRVAPSSASVPANGSAPALATIDIEASGFGSRSYPIEIGFVRPDGDGWCTLVRPAGDWTHWDGGAEGVHGIRRETLFAHGRDARVVAEHLNEALGGLVVYSDAWAHDHAWLAKLFHEAGMAPAFKLESVRRLAPEDVLATLPALLAEAREALAVTRHRASSDARALQWALSRLPTRSVPVAAPLPR